MVAYYYFDSPDTNFYIDPTFTYISTTNQNTAKMFRIVDSTPCPSSAYWNSSQVQCQPCPVTCTACILSTNCSSCSSGYQLASNWTCIANSSSPNNSSSSGNTGNNINYTTSINSTHGGQLATLKYLVNVLLTNPGLVFLNRIPGSRKMLPFLCYLVNIDELWLYMYHENNYGTAMNDFFTAMQTL